jgi:uncharacterized membrane protein (DUF106 family)
MNTMIKSVSALILTVMLTGLIGLLWSSLERQLNANQQKMEALQQELSDADKRYEVINGKLDLILHLLKPLN